MKFLHTLSFLLFFCWSAFGQENSRQQFFNLEDNLALEGYDPVSYFNGKPLEGKREFAATFNGVVYYFVDPKNKAVFLKTPGKYEPAYGGWCAYAMGESGDKVKVDPETYKITDGRLFLFYNFWGNNTLKSWNKNEKDLRINADKNWTKIIN